ncbi:hypothetical protein [Streptomyces sp. NRRL S-813]|uniref:hypothetical protein n=1 Tax=Streptomyces sp. NRRL S-813 TaxID=1463919 RepID=UPI000AD08A42|nr:hypothetical protein [Streptomyces sp. NRRL S-813]
MATLAQNANVATGRQGEENAAGLGTYEVSLNQRVMSIPRVEGVTLHVTMKTVKPVP